MKNDGYLVPNPYNPELKSFLGNEAKKIKIRTRDLVCWSFQIASGMNHLAKKKVNILLIGYIRVSHCSDLFFFFGGAFNYDVKWYNKHHF